MEAAIGIEPMNKVLQTSALPLGYAVETVCCDGLWIFLASVCMVGK